jgi:pSer/pThr/pTyr-binding forkhead associated (FHA) protein
MEDYLDIRIDVFENSGQHACVRRTLTIAAFIDEILREFDEIGGLAENYAVYMSGSDKPLARNKTINQLDIQPWDELVFDYRNKTLRRNLSQRERYRLRAEKDGKLFEIAWQPAVIGRPSNDADHNIRLAVNMQHIAGGDTISRRHAHLLYENAGPVIERLSRSNPVYVNGAELPYEQPRQIKHGDRLEFGRNRIALIVDRKPTMMVPPKTLELDFHNEVEPILKKTAQAKPAAPQEAEEPKAGMPAARLTVIKGETPRSEGAALLIDRETVAIGRDSFNLSNKSGVSRNHAEIRYDGAKHQFTLIDLKSTNGVSIDEKPIPPGQPVELKPGARVGLGKEILLQFELVQEA